MSGNNPISPDHYKQGDTELKEIFQISLSREELRGSFKTHIWEYVYRHPEKNGIEDLRKALWFLDHWIADEKTYINISDDDDDVLLTKLQFIQDIEIMERIHRPNQLRGYFQLSIEILLNKNEKKGGLKDLYRARSHLDRLILNEEIWLENKQYGEAV